MDPLPVTAIIPTLNNQEGLTNLLAQLKKLGIPVLVMNNQPNNLGFAEAVNLGVKQAKTKWLLILNDDVEGINGRLVKRLIGKADDNNWEAVSPILMNAHGKVENIGYKVLPIGKVELNFDIQKYSSRDLDGLTAACLLIKREVFNKLDGFDVRFFAYLEDVDLFLRFKQMGYQFGIDADIRVTHQHQATSSRMKKGFKQKRDMINWWRIMAKHPRRFIFQPQILGMLIERGRNVSGYFKAN